MTRRHTTPIDHRPFQSKSVLEQQTALERHYGKVAIDEVVAALHHIKNADAGSKPVAKAA